MQRILVAVILVALPAIALANPLPSWNDTEAKTAIIAFVDGVVDPDSDSFVPVEDRIAVFDNDGTLWSEQPANFQHLYALDVLREKADADPSILTSDALKAAAGDMAGMMAGGEQGLVEIVNVSHSGLTVEDFKADARERLTLPAGIMRHIGQRPIFAAGNSDGDVAMLEWTTAGEGSRFGMLVHHTDGERAFAYDREGHFGVLAKVSTRDRGRAG
jgi:hypothetical protein